MTQTRNPSALEAWIRQIMPGETGGATGVLGGIMSSLLPGLMGGGQAQVPAYGTTGGSVSGGYGDSGYGTDGYAQQVPALGTVTTQGRVVGSADWTGNLQGRGGSRLCRRRARGHARSGRGSRARPTVIRTGRGHTTRILRCVGSRSRHNHSLP